MSRFCWDKDENALCTPAELVSILMSPTGGRHVFPTEPYDQVYPGIYLGDASTARNFGLLKKLRIGYVLNAAHGIDASLFMIDASPSDYEEHGIKFLGIPALDITSFPLENFFEECSDFIENAVNSGGNVLVHCRVGISRSATLVLAYLIIRKGLTAQDAVRTVRTYREIMPNDGFLQQLCKLNEKVHRGRLLPGVVAAADR